MQTTDVLCRNLVLSFLLFFNKNNSSRSRNIQGVETFDQLRTRNLSECRHTDLHKVATKKKEN